MINTLEDLEKYGYNIDNLTDSDWKHISIYYELSESFIEEFQDRIVWDNISAYQKLSESFIGKFQDKVNWEYISVYQKLSESFIEEYRNKVDWNHVSVYQNLSESFIEKFQDKVDWYSISKYQKLSELFIEEYKNKVNWIYISKYQKLSKQFIDKYRNRLNLDLIKDSWHYKSTEFKKEQVINTNLYEYYDDYFIAYKGIRSDNYSAYNFQYQYFLGNIYESNADYSNEEDSFGLSAWTHKKVKEYCNEKIIKVKIYYKDVARVVHNGGKIRCCKFEVLEEVE